jgi:hypothetical protein
MLPGIRSFKKAMKDPVYEGVARADESGWKRMKGLPQLTAIRLTASPRKTFGRFSEKETGERET